MEKTPIQEAYDKVQQLMVEKPGNASIFDAIVELKTVTDQQILKNLQDIYWEDWESTAARQEFDNMEWRVKLENNLLKRELGVEVSISQLILQISWALGSNLSAVKNEQKEEVKEEVKDKEVEDKEEKEDEEPEISQPEEIKEWEDEISQDDLIQFTDIEDSDDKEEEVISESIPREELTEEQKELMKKYIKTDFYDNRDYDDPKVKKEVEKTYRKISAKLTKERKESSLDLLWVNKSEEEKQTSLHNELYALTLKQRIIGIVNKNPESLRKIFTDEEFYKWNFEGNPVFIKDSSLLVSDPTKKHGTDTLYLTTLAGWLWMKKRNEDFVYGEAYQRLLLEIFWKEFVDGQREVLRDEIKRVLKKKFEENPEIEKVWFLKQERENLIQDWKNFGEYFAVRIDKEILSLKDIARWIWVIIPFEEVIDPEKILMLVFWEEEFQKRKDALIHVEVEWEKEEKQEEQDKTIVFDGDEWSPILKDGEEPTIDIEETFLNNLYVEDPEEVEKKLEESDMAFIKNAFLETAKKIARCKVDYYVHPLDWISQEDRDRVVEWYRKQFPYANSELDKNIWEDKDFLDDSIINYIDWKCIEADGLFFVSEKEEDENWFEFCMDLLYILDDDWRYGDFSSFFIGEIFYKFWESHEANVKIQKELTGKDVVIERKDDELEPGELHAEEKEVKKDAKLEKQEKDAEKYWISLEEYQLLEKLIAGLNKVCKWTKKKKDREMDKFAKMISEGQNFRIDDFLKDNKLDEFPKNLVDILNELEIESVHKQKGAKNTFVAEKLVPTNKKIPKKGKNNNRLGFSGAKLSKEYIMKNPADWVIISLKQNNFGILNERELRKQVEGYCWYSEENRKDLADCLMSDNFWQLNKKTNGKDENEYSINVTKTAWRFLVRKIDKTYYVTWFYKHDVYERKLNSKN